MHVHVHDLINEPQLPWLQTVNPAYMLHCAQDSFLQIPGCTLHDCTCIYTCTNALLVQLTTSSCVFVTLSVPLNCSAVLCAQPECDHPITPPGQCCPLCPVDGSVHT